eukprot:Nk52_evm3s152 gene=Nk52_evmTU3s152
MFDYSTKEKDVLTSEYMQMLSNDNLSLLTLEQCSADWFLMRQFMCSSSIVSSIMSKVKNSTSEEHGSVFSCIYKRPSTVEARDRDSESDDKDFKPESVCCVEIRTMTNSKTTREAKARGDGFAECELGSEEFKKLVHSSSYRWQVCHHLAVLDVDVCCVRASAAMREKHRKTVSELLVKPYLPEHFNSSTLPGYIIFCR